MSIILAAAAIVSAFNCELAAPQAVSLESGKATASAIGLPAASLRFAVSFAQGNPMMATVAWPGDPMQVAGEYPVVTSAPGAYAFSAFSGGPCLFTEQSCLTQVNLVESGNGQARVIVTPVALTQDEKSKVRSPFVVIATGQCIRTDMKK